MPDQTERTVIGLSSGEKIVVLGGVRRTITALRAEEGRIARLAGAPDGEDIWVNPAQVEYVRRGSRDDPDEPLGALR
jgi:hypothetical protein